MGFSQKIVNQTVNKGGMFRHTFTHDNDKKIMRINPLCSCIKYSVSMPDITFWYKANKTTTKIVVITYDDESSDFLQLQTNIK